MPSVPIQLPSHLSEATFRLYEPHIKRAVERWPQETEFGRECMLSRDGNPLSSNTFVARLRDAFVSLREFQWETTVDVAKLESMIGTFRIALDPVTGHVWWRSKIKQGAVKGLAGRAIIRVGQDNRQMWPAGWTKDEVVALCRLIHFGRLEGPFVLEGKVTVDVVLEMEQGFNVSLVLDEEGNKTIIT